MAAEAHAARLRDPVAHSHALAGFLAGAVVGFVATLEAAAVIGAVVGAVALEVGTAGLATPLVIGVAATVAEVGLTVVAGGVITNAAQNEGEKEGSESLGDPTGAVAQGSPNVLINGLPAARATDQETCHSGKIAQGSRTVGINGLGAARVGDKTTCGAVISQGSANVLIGGPTGTYLGIQSEVPSWVRWAVVVATVAVSLGSAAREIGPMLAEINETGLARALQTGAKALKTSMEEKGGGLGAVDSAELARVKALPNGSRPPPESYLPSKYIDAHLEKFDNGGSYLTPTRNLDRFGRDNLGRPDGVFLMPKSEMDDMLARTGGNTGKIETEMGIPAGTWDQPGNTLSRIDVADPRSLNLRMPSGNEGGANNLWKPGGQLPTGGSEAVVDQIPKGSYTESLVGGK